MSRVFRISVANRARLFRVTVSRLVVTVPNFSSTIRRWDGGDGFDIARPSRAFDARDFKFDDNALTFDTV